MNNMVLQICIEKVSLESGKKNAPYGKRHFNECEKKNKQCFFFVY